MTRHYMRQEPLDLVVRDGEALVLLPPDRVARLSQIATAIYEATAQPKSVDELTALVTTWFGVPPGAVKPTHEVGGIVRQLCEAGLLRELANE